MVIIREIRYFDATKNRISRPTHERRRLLRAAATEATAAAAREIRYTRRASFPKVSTRFRYARSRGALHPPRTPPTSNARVKVKHAGVVNVFRKTGAQMYIIKYIYYYIRLLQRDVYTRYKTVYKSELYYTTNITLLL